MYAGPLSILRDTWLGFRNLPISLGKRTEDFLKEVKGGMDAAQKYADESTRLAQHRYVHQYNLRSRTNKLTIGQLCLILQPDITSSRMFARWKGPAKVVEVKWPIHWVGNSKVISTFNALLGYHQCEVAAKDR
jgi:hypothetical protein